MINHIKFCKKFCDKYHDKYFPQLSDDIIADIVDTVLNRAPDNYFTWEQVQEHPEFCKQCGACCKTLDCPYFNGKTCDEYATRYDSFYEINARTGLILDPACNFCIKLAEMVLDEEFKKNLDLLEVD